MKIGILTIATNKYIKYFSDLVDSYIDEYPEFTNVEWFLFTDQLETAHILQNRNLPFKLTIIPIPSYGFPEATLFRYKIYVEHEYLLNSDVLVHLDADMLIMSHEFLDVVLKETNSKKLTLVRHPGFYRSKGKAGINFYVRHPSFALKDIKQLVKLGGIGAWETNKNSKAYVPRNLRKEYFCGGIWFGKRETVTRMCEVLSSNVASDLDLNYVAKWHDESHLNYYAAMTEIHALEPNVCFEPTYSNLEGLQEIVRAVNKGA